MVGKLNTLVKLNMSFVGLVLAYFVLQRVTNGSAFLEGSAAFSLGTSTLGFASFLLFLSSGTSILAGRMSKGSAKTSLIFTQVFGLLFLGVLGRELGYLSQMELPFVMGANFYSSLYFIVMYVFIAELVLAIALLFLTYFQLEFSAENTATQKLLKLSTSFWNGIVVLWIVVFFLLYLI